MGQYSLHTQLARHYAGDHGQTEVRVGRYMIDAIADGTLVEIQVANFHAIRGKLAALTRTSPVLLVFPVPYEKWFVHVDRRTGKVRSRRKSPKRGRPHDILPELPYIAPLLSEPNLELEIVMTRENEFRSEARSRWARYAVDDRELINIVCAHRLAAPGDYLAFLPQRLRQPFTNRALAFRMDVPRAIAAALTHSLRKIGALEQVGRTADGILHAIPQELPGGRVKRF